MTIVRLALMLLLALTSAGSARAAEDAVRDDLARAKPVWYDPQRDDWRRVEVPEPKSPDLSSEVATGGAIAATTFAYIVAAVAVGVLVWLVTLVFRSRTALLREQREVEAAPLRRADISALAFAPREGRGDPEAALAAALRARDWGLAAVWIYTLMLLRLDRAGVVRLAPGKTNGVYRTEARRGPAAAAEALGAGIAVFERSYFGHLPVSEGEIGELRQRRETLEAAVTEAKPA